MAKNSLTVHCVTAKNLIQNRSHTGAKYGVLFLGTSLAMMNVAYQRTLNVLFVLT